MDHLIRNAWRMFWVGLGASAVLIAQSFVTTTASGATSSDVVEPRSSEPSVRPAQRRPLDHANPVLTRGSMDARGTREMREMREVPMRDRTRNAS